MHSSFIFLRETPFTGCSLISYNFGQSLPVTAKYECVIRKGSDKETITCIRPWSKLKIVTLQTKLVTVKLGYSQNVSTGYQVAMKADSWMVNQRNHDMRNRTKLWDTGGHPGKGRLKNKVICTIRWYIVIWYFRVALPGPKSYTSRYLTKDYMI